MLKYKMKLVSAYETFIKSLKHSIHLSNIKNKQKANALFGYAEGGKVFRFQSSRKIQFHSNKNQKKFYNVSNAMTNSYHQFY